MKCSNCSFQNSPDSKFCENCGQPFDRGCPNCNNPVSPNSKFCKNCGFNLASVPASSAARLADLQQATPRPLQEKILSTRTQIEGERKLVTVLFTDIVGSTTLAEKMDPEEWGEIVSGAHQRVTQAIFRYEGTIAQLLGDGVLAFFGAPVTHEDDPVRAVNAALDILVSINEYGNELRKKKRIENFQMRIGLNTGLVVVGSIGGDLHMEYLAVGETVNLAARMQSAAEPNTILVSQNSARWVKHAFDLDPRGALEVKGKTEPVAAFRIVARKPIPEPTRGIEGLNSPLVGRERELKMLQARVDELMQGRGQIVSVMGDAGLGKSRLIAELRKWTMGVRDLKLEVGNAASNLQSPTSNFQWFEGRSLSYESSTPYAPFIDLFSRLCHLREEESDAERYNKIKETFEIVADDHLSIAPFIATLLGIKLEGDELERVRYLEPPQLREKIFSATLHFVEHLANKQPLVLVFEDLHWADSISLSLLEQLMRLAEESPVMILALFRPQTQEPSWRFHQAAQRDHAARYTSIAIEPLDETNARQLVANLLEIEDLPEKVRALILKKAEGNPFFVEEVIRSLLDAKLVVRDNSHWRATREIENIQLPDTLAGVIGARLDRLDDDSKKAAQTAAVVGREFQFDILADVYDAKPKLDPALENLQRRELVREKSRTPALVYLFKHALTQETAYASLLLSKRRNLHRQVAECLERLEPERVHDIARNFLEAQEEVRALPFLVEAGERAARAYSTPEAIGYLTRAVEILQNVTDTPLARRAYDGLGGALMLSMQIPRALVHFNAMIEYGKAHRDVPMQVSAHNKLGMILGMYMGQFEEAENHLLEAERLGREHQDGAGLSELFTTRCMICTMQADFTNAAHYLSESVNVGRQMNLSEPMAFGLTHTANTFTYMARFDDAFEKGKEALVAAEQIGNQKFVCEVYSFVNPLYFFHIGNLDRAREDADKGTRIAERIGDGIDHAIGLYLQGMIAHWRGEYENALALHQRALKVSQASAFPSDTLPLAEMIAIYHEISDDFSAKVIELDQQTQPRFENPMIAATGAPARASIGLVFLEMNKVEDAAAQIEKGLNYPSFMGPIAKPRLLAGKALVAMANKQMDDAAKFIGEARTFAEEHAMKHEYPFVFITEAKVCKARGDLPSALDHFSRAESLALEMNMRPMIWQARAGAAKVLSALGRAQEADAKKQAAKAMIEEIAGMFKDEKMRVAFVESAMEKIKRET